MDDWERAPEYLLSLQEELDEMGRFPPGVIPAVLFSGIGGILLGAGLLGLFSGNVLASLPWITVGGLIMAPGVLLGFRVWEWYRRVKSLEHGISLFDARQRMREAESTPSMGRSRLRNPEPLDSPTTEDATRDLHRDTQ